MKLAQCDSCQAIAPDTQAVKEKWIHLNWRQYEAPVTTEKPLSGKFDVCQKCQPGIMKMFLKNGRMPPRSSIAGGSDEQAG